MKVITSLIIIIIIIIIKRLRPSKSVGLDDIPGLITKGCTDIFVPILKYIVA
jgi:hypothetical protein